MDVAGEETQFVFVCLFVCLFVWKFAAVNKNKEPFTDMFGQRIFFRGYVDQCNPMTLIISRVDKQP